MFQPWLGGPRQVTPDFQFSRKPQLGGVREPPTWLSKALVSRRLGPQQFFNQGGAITVPVYWVSPRLRAETPYAPG